MHRLRRLRTRVPGRRDQARHGARYGGLGRVQSEVLGGLAGARDAPGPAAGRRRSRWRARENGQILLRGGRRGRLKPAGQKPRSRGERQVFATVLAVRGGVETFVRVPTSAWSSRFGFPRSGFSATKGALKWSGKKRPRNWSSSWLPRCVR